MRLFKLFNLCFFASFVVSQNKAKMPLSKDVLAPVTTYFKIENGVLNHAGQAFFADAFKTNQYFLLGEYHGSKRISEFTKATLPLFKNAGGNHIGLEVGPVSATVLSEIANKDKAKTVAGMHKLNSAFATQTPRGVYEPIPFFSNVSDAEFLSEIKTQELRILGLDQEFKFGIPMLIRRAAKNLPPKKQRFFAPRLKQLTDTLTSYFHRELAYRQKQSPRVAFVSQLFLNSPFVQKLLSDLASEAEENRAIKDALNTSMQIYAHNNARKYWDSNAARTQNFIQNLNSGVTRTGFNLASDKMYIKIGGLHSARGLNNYSMYDIGNTFAELARFHGNSSLHSTFFSRYSKDKSGKRVDELENKESWTAKSFADFLQMGKKDEWAIIDLRPLREKFYYKRIYEVNDRVREYFRRYDIIIIAPTEEEPKANYTLSK